MPACRKGASLESRRARRPSDPPSGFRPSPTRCHRCYLCRTPDLGPPARAAAVRSTREAAALADHAVTLPGIRGRAARVAYVIWSRRGTACCRCPGLAAARACIRSRYGRLSKCHTLPRRRTRRVLCSRGQDSGHGRSSTPRQDSEPAAPVPGISGCLPRSEASVAFWPRLAAIARRERQCLSLNIANI